MTRLARAVRVAHRCGTHRRDSAFALLATVLLITFLTAIVAQLVTVTATESVIVAHRARTIEHDLAVDSAVLLLADILTETEGHRSSLIEQLDRTGRASIAFDIGSVQVRCVLRDDAARFNPLLFQRPDQQMRLERKLGTLASRRSLPHATVNLKPVRTGEQLESGPLYLWYDQILSKVEPGSLFHWHEGTETDASDPVWSDAVTFWGEGRIDLRRVDAEVLEVALDDIRPGLARILLATRPADPSVNFTQSAMVGIDAEIRGRVAGRITHDARRYAINIETSIGGDRRRWYVVARISNDDATVYHRSRLTW